MQHQRILWLLLIVSSLSFSVFAQSGKTRAGGDKKQNRQPAPKTELETVIKPKAEQNADNAEDRSNQTDVVAKDEAIKIDTDLITIPVSVFDRDGRFVGGLTKEDFAVAENNEPQKIEFFAATETPYTVALVLDTSLSAKFKIDEIQTAAFQYVMNLRPNDRVLVVSFDEQVRFLNEQPTNDRETLRLAIKKTRFGGGTSLYEAVQQTFARLKKIAGRKAVVLFTDGVDTTSRAANDGDNLAQAQEFDALVYPVYYDTFDDVQQQMANPFPAPNPVPGSPTPLPTQTPTIPGTNLPFPQIPNRRRNPNDPNFPRNPNDPTVSRAPNDPNAPNDPRDNQDIGTIGTGASAAEYRRGKQYLEKLAEYTGGRFYAADSYVGLGKAFDQINADLRSQYSLGYYPTAPGSFGERRTIKVRVNRKKVAVRARDGYTVGRDKPKS